MNKFLLILSIIATILAASPIEVGSALGELNGFKYETPQGREIRVPKKPKLVIVAFEKDTGALVNEYLDTQDAFYLQMNRSIFIADINKMPTLITNMFALPKLRKYKHLIYLHYNDKLGTAVPNKEAKITLLRIEDGKIKNISYISTKEELKSAIEQ
ncbi:hypothetical protein HUE87_12040 [Candidatus Sulfurimonas marisnigri]|uniref:FAD/FMN-containing dehydrogenase n=1 Tax=Candidatus Sulfurimonas marisnigri TaxID=2740405 RepID=A0A7S7M1L6_9BACT|nr:hypothetical protein [Candidatus Sulfurimonas marisnigri]QOY54574.1 hypothetical protein HUE87_12040 [Candidatus Sulfurimonas marisnigri]